jgi:cell division protein FtsW
MSSVPMTDAGVETTPTTSGGWDWWLCVTALVLMGFGLLMSLSSSSIVADQNYGDALHFFTRQLAGLVLGFAVGVPILMLPYRSLRKSAWWFYLFTCLTLVTVFAFPAVKGSHRWIKLGLINLQPSEFAKLAVILILADYIARNEGRLRDMVGTVFPALIIVGLPMVLVLIEPDFGSTVILATLTGVLLFIGGLNWRVMAALGTVGVAGLGGIMVLEPYRVKRLVSFLDPFLDEQGAGHQVIQGWIALASGGWSGTGLGTGVAQRWFLPEAHTDFISCVVGEELGARGFILLIAMYGVIIWRGMGISSRAPDLFGQLVAGAVTFLLGMQAVINLGVVVGWLPAKGLVLPFMSYGASAITMHTMCIALLLRIGLESGYPVAATDPGTAAGPRSQG